MTAHEARTVKFSEVRNGFDREQVEEFRDAVADALQRWEREVAEVKQQLGAAEERLIGIAEAEEAVRQTFLAAATTKREMIAETKEQTDRELAEARAEAAKLREDAAREAAASRSAAEADAAKVRAVAQTAAAEAEGKARRRVQDLERRLVQMRTASREIRDRIEAFAATATDELGVTENLIDLETSSLEDIADLRRQEPVAAATPAPEVPPEADGEPPAEEPEVVAVPEPVAVVAEESAEPPAEEPEVAAVPEPVAAAPEPSRTVLRGADDDGFYQRRLAGLRRRIEGSSDS